jgi:hypothetical protein
MLSLFTGFTDEPKESSIIFFTVLYNSTTHPVRAPILKSISLQVNASLSSVIPVPRNQRSLFNYNCICLMLVIAYNIRQCASSASSDNAISIYSESGEIG